MRTLWAIRVALRAAWAVLRQNRWRSLLTLAICGLGTAGVILAGVLGKSNVAQMQERIRNLGGGLVVVSPNKLPTSPGRQRQIEHFISLEPDDATALKEHMPQIQSAVPVVARNTTIRHERNTSRVRLLGTTPEYARVRSFPLARGRFFNATDGAERVIILGHAASRELASEGLKPGDIVALGGQPYEVIGVLQPQGVNFAGEDEDHQVFIPLDAYRQRIANRHWLSLLYLQLTPDADSTRVTRRVQSLLHDRHGRWRDQMDDVVIRDFAELSAQQSGLLLTAVWAVSIISGLLLLLGVVGIGTLMLLVVRQRRAEIGLRRALGATPTDIAVQFLVEGLALSGVGILAGLIVGVGGAVVFQAMRSATAELDFLLIGLAVAVSLSACALACLLPAIAAARLEPAAALRS